jgi:competence protein ComEC
VWREGSAAVWLTPDGPVILTDRMERGDRPWVPPPPQPKARAAPALPPAALDSASAASVP